jgi:acyl-homoserine lactone acylase PvdQ
VDVANPRLGGQYDQRAGASTRFVCEAPTEGVRCSYQLPGGQVDDPASEHFGDLFELYVENRPTPIVFDVRDVQAVETITLR